MTLIPIATAANAAGHSCREFYYDSSFTYIYCLKTIDTDGTPPSLGVYLTGRIAKPLDYIRKRWIGTDDVTEVELSTKKFDPSARRRAVLNGIESALVAYSDDATGHFLYTGEKAARVCWSPPGFLARTRISLPLTSPPTFNLGHATLTISPAVTANDVTLIASKWLSTPHRSASVPELEACVIEWNSELLRAVTLMQKALSS